MVRFFGEPLTFGLAPGMLGRVFNGVGQVIDGGPPIAAKQRQRIEGLPINPVARAGPRDFIETGVSTLDLMNSLVRGQKLPIFSGGGLPHDRLAVEIASHARLRPAPGRAADGTDGADGADDFVIVFAGIGVPHDSAEFFRRSLEQGGALERTALFLNLASDSSTQQRLRPHAHRLTQCKRPFGTGVQHRAADPADDGPAHDATPRSPSSRAPMASRSASRPASVASTTLRPATMRSPAPSPACSVNSTPLP